jgi:hypothetical protein
MWAEEVKPDSIVYLRSPPPHYLNASPPPYVSGPQPPKMPTTSYKRLGMNQIWDAEGYHKLCFAGSPDKALNFMVNSLKTNYEILALYLRIRSLAIPERWADLHGNMPTNGQAVGLDYPQVNVGPVLAGRIAGLENCVYVIVVRAMMSKILREREGDGYPAHLHGNSIYMWIPYPSRQHAVAGLEECLGNSYSVVATWAEFDLSKFDRSSLGGFAGRVVRDRDGREFFAVVGDVHEAEAESYVEIDRAAS